MASASLSETRGFQCLLTPDGYNPKTKKGRARGYATAILHLAPASLSGYNVCPSATAGCAAACLNTAGHGGIIRKGETTNAIQLARIARTRLFFTDRFTFNIELVKEIQSHVRRAVKHGLIPVVRPNGTSDLPWERLRLNDGRTLMETFPTIQFYDYTKVTKRALANVAGHHPANYALTFSRAESNHADVATVLAAGGNVAAVFVKYLPAEYQGTPVLNGDLHDLRFLDERRSTGMYVGLKAKGRLGKRDASGFVIQPVITIQTATATVAVAA